jgi:hypothetical protein
MQGVIMKIRNGFVSNSSSTSFTFVFKGDNVKDLSEKILKYKSHFNLSFDTSWPGYDGTQYYCNALDVVEAIENCVVTPKYEDDKVSVCDIDEYIGSLVELIKENDREIEKEKKEENKRYNLFDLFYSFNQDLKAKIEKLRGAKKNGLTSVLIIGFGDNNGNISGGDLGYCMDYEGRYISIDEKDFLVLTEQDR